MPPAGAEHAQEVPSPQGGDSRLIRVGALITLVGMALTAVAVLPLLTGLELPSVFWALAMTTGVGFGLVLLGLWRNGARRARVQRDALGAVGARPSRGDTSP